MSQSTPSEQPLQQSQPTQVDRDRAEIHALIATHYVAKTRDYYLGLVQRINSLDVRERFFQSLRDGYAGFEVAKHPRIATFTSEMRRDIGQLLTNKIREAGLEELAYFFRREYNLCILVKTTDRFMDLNDNAPDTIVIHDTGLSPTERLDRLEVLTTQIVDSIGSPR
jgi:hypothetical protein